MATIYRAVFQVAGPSVRLAASSLFEEWIGGKYPGLTIPGHGEFESWGQIGRAHV